MTKRKRRPHVPGARVTLNGVALTLSQDRAWRAANDDLASEDFSRRKRGHIALRSLETRLADDEAQAGVERGIDETLVLERSRGERIDIATSGDGRRRVRIRSRDGLDTLLATGSISAVQQRAGLLYRDLYEAADPERDLRSQMAAGTMTGAGGGSAAPGSAEAWAERRLRLAGTMAAIERKVRLADRNGRGVRALREIAGNARCLSHFVDGGGAQAAYRRALCLALDVCVAHFRLG